MDSTDNPLFWHTIDELVTSARIIIDRPRGSTHPRLPAYVYPFDYGYLEGTASGDGQGIDVWVGSGEGVNVTGVICAVDLTKRDAELKILIDCLPEEIDTIYADHNFGGRAGLLVRRPFEEDSV